MNVNNIKVNNRCVCCGMCQSACPLKAVKMEYSDTDGFYYPNIDESICMDCGRCVECCPADAMTAKSQSLIGKYKRLFLAHSNSEKIRWGATSGGVVNSLIRYLIRKEIVQAALITGFDVNSKIEASAIAIDKNNVHLLSDEPRWFESRYVSVPVLSNIRDLLKTGDKIAVVGTPCQLLAIKNFSGGGTTCDSRLLTIGIACSGGISYKATEQYKHSKHRPGANMFYRGEGWPGKNSLVSENETIDQQHLDSVFENMFSSQIFTNPGCRNCQDQFAENSDISFCDFWDPVEKKTETVGNSCVIVRTRRAQNIFDDMIRDGCVAVIRELSELEVIRTQISVLRVKKGNIREQPEYVLFEKIVGWVFRHRIYQLFPPSIYHLFRRYYGMISGRSHLSLPST